MNCKVCGAQLTGTENVCPVCGAPIEKINENVAPTVPVSENPIAPVDPVAPVEVQPVMPEPVAPVAPVEVQPVMPEPVAPVAPVEVQPVMPEPVAPVAPVEVQPVMPEPVAPVAPVEVQPVMPEPVAPVAPVEVQPVMPEPVAPVASAPIVEPQPVNNPFQQGPVMAAPQEEKPVKQKRQVNVKFIVFMVVGIALIGFFAWLYFSQADPEEQKTPATPSTPEVEDTDVVDEVFSYNGQEFALPEDYETTTSNDYGIIITNNDYKYTFEVDYTNNLEAYKNKLTETYPDKAATFTKTIDGREYYIVEVKDSTDAIANLYVTKIKNDYVVTGFITNSNFTALTDDDLTGLNTIFNNIIEIEDFDKSTSTFGKDGVKLLTFDKTKLS